MSRVRSRSCQSRNRPFLPYRLPRRKQWQQRTPTLLKCFSRDEKVLGEMYTPYTKLMSRSCQIRWSLRCKISFQKHSCLVQFLFLIGLQIVIDFDVPKLELPQNAFLKNDVIDLSSHFLAIAWRIKSFEAFCGLSLSNIYSGFRMNSTYFHDYFFWKRRICWCWISV